jgi:ABC-type antimicrobial peptide transport system permease subunit
MITLGRVRGNAPAAAKLDFAAPRRESFSSMNWNTFTDVTFAFRVTPGLAGRAIGLALLLGLLGGLLPAIRAALLEPVTAIRRL